MSTDNHLLKSLNDPKSNIAKLIKEWKPSPEWWKEHFKRQKELQEKLDREHDSIKMSWEKFHQPFTI